MFRAFSGFVQMKHCFAWQSPASVIILSEYQKVSFLSAPILPLVVDFLLTYEHRTFRNSRTSRTPSPLGLQRRWLSSHLEIRVKFLCSRWNEQAMKELDPTMILDQRVTVTRKTPRYIYLN